MFLVCDKYNDEVLALTCFINLKKIIVIYIVIKINEILTEFNEF